MKHGDKAKSKKASKASGEKSSKAVASSKSAAKSSKSGENGRPRARLTPDAITFSNPLVANAFKRAIKKYPNAFRRLTD